MSVEPSVRPPRLAEAILEAMLPAVDRHPVSRDLAELFAVHFHQRGDWRARGWYWKQVLSFTARLGLERILGVSAPHLVPHCRRFTGGTLMNSVIQDVRYAIRGLLRSPGFAVVALVTLALGVGASTSIFSVVNGILLRPLPFSDSDRLVALYRTEEDGERDNHSGANFLDIKTQSRSLSGLAGHRGMRYTVVGGETPQLVRGSSVTSDFFDVLGVPALIGRTLSPEVDLPGAERTVVLSYGMWQSQFAGDPDVLGKRLKANDELYTVVGVMPPGFEFPDESEFWAASRYAVPESPVDVGDDPATVRNLSWLGAVARLADGVTLEQAQVEMTLIAERITKQHPEVDEGTLVVPLRESMVGDVRASLLVLLGAVGFLLLIACANVANLLLVRASAREREISVRSALGAGRVRILRQLMTESLVLALAGGGLGLLLALWGTRGLLALAPDGIPRVAEVSTDLRVLGFALAVALGAGVVFGLAPALQSFGTSFGRSAVGGAARQTAGRSRSTLRNALIVGEVAVSLLLLVGAGLMVRTLVALSQVDPGFGTEHLLSARVWIPATKYSEDEQVVWFYREVLGRVEAIPGVQSVGGVLSLPVNAGINGTFGFSIEGWAPEAGEAAPIAGFQIADSDYLETIGIPLLSGRWFTDGDDVDATPVAVVNEALVDTYFPDQDPIGKRVVFDGPEAPEEDWMTIVGVIGNTRHFGLDQPPRAEIYQPYLQGSLPYLTLVVKSEMDVGALTSAVRGAVSSVDPEQPISGVATMEQVLFDSLGSRRFNMTLLAVFAVAAVVLAAVGLFGVLSYSVAQRANEIGIRMALGARGGNVVGQIMKQGVGLAVIGLLIGTGGAVALTRLMTSMIHGVSATDPYTFLAGAVALAAVAALASCVPALRASRVDPIEALRTE